MNSPIPPIPPSKREGVLPPPKVPIRGSVTGDNTRYTNAQSNTAKGTAETSHDSRLTKRVIPFSTYKCEACTAFWKLHNDIPELLGPKEIMNFFKHLHEVHGVPPLYIEEMI